MTATLALILSMTIPTQAPPTGDLARFTGKYVFIGGEAERANVASVIDDAAESFNFMIRGIARDRLKAKNRITSTITFTVQGQTVGIATDFRDAWESAVDGTPKRVKAPNGRDVDLRRHLEGSSITETLGAGKGSRKHVFTLSPDGTVLTFDVTVISDQLSKPLSYKLTFKRQ